MRLTASSARQSGASFYRGKVDVVEGFDTTFIFQMANPSVKCVRQDDVNTFCRSRGADGLSFIIQDNSLVALGSAGHGLGYDGIPNSLVVEFDTFFNFELMDPYENHISVMTQVLNCECFVYYLSILRYLHYRVGGKILLPITVGCWQQLLLLQI